ncbi:MAG TPA: FAD-dependent oxidoreductase [Candidatus Dormibacteraeota bacterium]|nr:FAD-dependent oxidoreductase [Candidatus Dormibacteraeota bacterium]
MWQLFSRQRMWHKRELQPKYDIVIIGAGIHGLAIAYYLCKRGVRSIALIEKSYLGAGNSGRNTAILRSNYRTPEGIPFYDESIRMWEGLSGELDYNLLFSQQGHITLAHTDASLVGLRIRAEANRVLGVDSRMVDPGEIKKMVPSLYIGPSTRYPIMGGLYHPPGGNIRHDAVVWGYARGADRLGAEIHTRTEVTGIERTNGRITGVCTTRGNIKTGIVVNATSGWCTTIARLAGVSLPVTSHPLQACVTEPLKPFLDKVIVSANLHVYVNQSDRGELVLGSEIDPYTSYSQRSTLPTLEMIAGHTLELFPSLKHVSIMRQWTGVCDMTPDYSPIMGESPELKGFILDVGWGTYGFKAGPVAGARIAELIDTGRTPELIRPFLPDRFATNRLVGEKAAAAVST